MKNETRKMATLTPDAFRAAKVASALVGKPLKEFLSEAAEAAASSVLRKHGVRLMKP